MNKISAWVGVVGVTLVFAHATLATTPLDTASGVFAVSQKEVMFAFRVDPWSQDTHQIRGVGRVSIDEDNPFDLYFEIAGTYRPASKNTSQGVFVYRNANSIKSIPWQGSFDPIAKCFNWSVTLDDQKVELPRVMARTVEQPKAAPAPKKPEPKNKTSYQPPARKRLFLIAMQQAAKSDSLLDKDGDIDIGKVLIRVIQKLPDAKPSPSNPKSSDDSNQSSFDAGKEDLGIIKALTDLGAGKEKSVGPFSPQQLLDGAIRGKQLPGGPIRKRAVYPPIDQPRELETLTKPAIQPRRVPKVVGLKFESAVAVLWSAGLTTGSVECLGESSDPSKADFVVDQSPDETEPYPEDKQVGLKWYAKPLSPSESSETTSKGFHSGDGALVDSRFAAAKVAANSNAIGGGGSRGDESYNWAVYKLDEPSLQKAAEGIRSSFATSANGAKSSETTEIVVAQNKQSESESILEYSAHDRFKREETFDKTTYLHYRVYRGFLMHYGCTKKGLNQPLGETGESVMERSQQLIDKRFPK